MDHGHGQGQGQSKPTYKNCHQVDVFTLESYDLYRCLGTRGFCRVRGAYLKLDTGRVVYSLLSAPPAPLPRALHRDLDLPY